jgi:hypothetical protein
MNSVFCKHNAKKRIIAPIGIANTIPKIIAQRSKQNIRLQYDISKLVDFT